MSSPETRRSLGVAKAPSRRKAFITYYSGDKLRAQYFVSTLANEQRIFLPKAIGLTYSGDELIDSKKKSREAIHQLRQRYIDDSSVQIVLIGSCTHSRRFVDWEIRRSLLSGNGLIGILLPHLTSAYMPERFKENYKSGNTGYARFYSYPTSGDELRTWIEDAFLARTTRAHMRQDTGEAWGEDQECRTCFVIH